SGQMVEFKRLRGSGIFMDPNDLSLLVTVGLLIALWALTDGGQGVFRFAWLGPLALFLYAFSLTQSRGGMIGLLIGLLVLFTARFGWRRALLLAVPLVPGVLVAVGGRMSSLSASEGTGQTRIQIWSDGLFAMRSAPLFGVGMHEFGAQSGKAAHNTFLHAYAE